MLRAFFKNVTTDIVGLHDTATVAEPSLFEFALEDGSGTLYLEDGSGNYIQDLLQITINESLGVTG